MKVQILSVNGIPEALYGLGLSYGKTKPISYGDFQDGLNFLQDNTVGTDPVLSPVSSDILNVCQDMITRATINAPIGKGHSKFLESIDVHFLITAPRFWWQEMDTYRLATKQSDSTMHTLMKETKDDNNDIAIMLSNDTFIPINDKDNKDDYDECMLFLKGLYAGYSMFTQTVHESKLSKTTKKLFIKHPLPEVFSNTRQEKLSYSSLRNIYHQRKNHELPHWHVFCDAIKTLPHSEWVTSDTVSE